MTLPPDERRKSTDANSSPGFAARQDLTDEPGLLVAIRLSDHKEVAYANSLDALAQIMEREFPGVAYYPAANPTELDIVRSNIDAPPAETPPKAICDDLETAKKMMDG